MDEILRALASSLCRRVLQRLSSGGRPQALHELCVGLDAPRPALLKSMAMLRAARLVATQRGRAGVRYAINAVPIALEKDRRLARTWVFRYDPFLTRERQRVTWTIEMRLPLRGPVAFRSSVFPA
jgi:hypothetical protein